MKGGWPIKPIGELCDIVGGGTPSKSNADFFGGGIPWATVRDMKADWIEATEHSITPAAVKSSATHILPAGTVVIASRVGLGKVCRVASDTAINQDLRGFIPKAKIQLDHQYLFWWFKSVADRIVAAGNGATVQGVTLPFLRSLPIPLPPLEEQRRIVAVLDKAFAGITTATANAQKNLTNARALFEDSIEQAFAGSAERAPWANHTVDSAAASHRGSIRTGPFGSQLLHSEFVDEGIAVLGIDNAVTNEFRWDKLRFISPEKFKSLSRYRVFPGDVIITIMGTCGRCAVIPDDVPLAINTKHLCCITVDTKKCLPDFMHAYFLYHPTAREYLGRTAKGSIMAGLNMGLIKEMPLLLPTVTEQKRLIALLAELKRTTDDLASNLTAKLAALAELKQSLLQKAFAGELTTAIADPVAPAANDNFATAPFTAQVIAFAHRRHERQHSQKTFGHVKAQKVLHLVESAGGIDLGRQPIKDAAGPNDFQHMLRATDWAVHQGFFEFVPRIGGKGYDFKKLANYDALFADALAATKPVRAVLEKVIDLIVPMVSLDAEVFVTVHAAWNNLIRDGVAITDDAIVKAARDDWHSAKLKIPEHKFRDSIRTIKAKGMEPDGTAKYVGGQAKLI